MSRIRSRREAERPKMLRMAVAGTLLAILVYVSLERADAAEEDEGRNSWNNWHWDEQCEYHYGDAAIGTGPLERRSCIKRWVYTSPEPEPEPDPEPEPEPEPAANLAEVTTWGCTNGSRCSGEPKDGQLSIRHGGGAQNSPGAGSEQPLEPGKRYRIQYRVASCTADPCAHRFATGPGQKSKPFEGAVKVDERITADKPRLNLTLHTANKQGVILIEGLRITAAP